MTHDPDRCQVECIHPEQVQRAQAQLADELTSNRLAEFFRVLGDPTRVRLLSALRAGELCVCDLSATLVMSQSAISHQLRLLRQMHLVKRRKAGQIAYYSLDDEHVSTLVREGMDHVRHGADAVGASSQ